MVAKATMMPSAASIQMIVPTGRRAKPRFQVTDAETGFYFVKI